MKGFFVVAVVFVVVLGLSEARPNFIERLQAALDYIQSGENATLYEMFQEHLAKHRHEMAKWRGQRATLPAVDQFHCLDNYVKNKTMPNSVHQLRPEHITVVAALGDSLTAGNGILGQNIFDCLTEYRGRSWSIGGDSQLIQHVRTVPNILKGYNYNLKGYSLGKCKTTDLGCSQLNVAVAGETSQDLPAQAWNLVSRINNRNDFNIDPNEWKMVTLFIGGNDLCEYCHDKIKFSPANYISKIAEALDIIKANIPRVFVNLVQIFDITPLASVSKGIMCNIVTNMVCDCAKDTQNNAMLTETSLGYQRKIEALVASDNYTSDDFVVVLQPFFKDTEPVKDSAGHYDLTYFAPDCFHFSEKGTYAAAKSLWNNMFEPVGAKRSSWFVHDHYHCPQEFTGYLRTNRN